MNKTKYPPTICILQPKGGVGKTTLSFCLARYAADYHNLKVLLIDTDKSANLSSLFIDIENNKILHHLRHVFTTASAGLSGINPHPVYITDPTEESPGQLGTIDLMPQLDDISFIDQASGFQVLPRLQQWIATCSHDLVVIDTPGWLANLTIASLIASTHYLCPLGQDPFGTREITSISDIVDVVNSGHRLSNPVQRLGYLPYAIHPRSVRYREFRSELDQQGYSHLLIDPDLHIEYRASVARATARKQPPWRLRPITKGQKSASANYLAVLDILIDRIINGNNVPCAPANSTERTSD